MGLMNSALHIGRSAISSYQGALSVVGNNIANAADPDYTRQNAVLEPIVGAGLPEGLQPGGGVALTSLQRVINEALQERLRIADADLAASEIEHQVLSRVESLFDELGEGGLSNMLSGFFRSLQDVQNNPTNPALRAVVVDQVAALTDTIAARRAALGGMVDDINGQIVSATTQANELAEKIAELNVEVVAAEASGQTASALRDRRDALLRELSGLVDITVRPQETGTVSVFIGNEALIQLGNSRGLTTELIVEEGIRTQQIHFGDGTGEVGATGARIGGLVSARDGKLSELVGELDVFARGFINAVNQAHVNGQGIEAYTAVLGTTTLAETDVALDIALAGGGAPVQSGSFMITVSDGRSGDIVETLVVDVDLDGTADDTTLNSLAEQINASNVGLIADVTAAGALAISAEPGLRFTFGHDGSTQRTDTSGALAALGINTLLAGSNAGDIMVNPAVAAKPELLAASGTHLVGNTDNIARLLDLQGSGLGGLGDRTLIEFYEQLSVELSTAAARAAQQHTVAGDVQASLQAERDSLSGVNLDEEAVNLVRFERAFQGAARFTSVVDRLLQDMISIVR